MLPLHALWLPAFQQASQDVKKKGRETLRQAPYLCVYPLSTWCYLLCASHTFLPRFTCWKQAKAGDGEDLEMVKTWERGYCLPGLTCLVVPGSHGPSQTCVSGRSSCGKCCKSLEQAGERKSDVQVCLLIFFFCSLIQTLTLTPPPTNALLANMDMWAGIRLRTCLDFSIGNKG